MTEPQQTPPQWGFGPPPGTPQPVEVNTGLAMGLAVATMLCACLPGGAGAAFLAYQAKQKANAGDEEGARKMLTYSYVVSGICLLLGVPFSIFYIMATLDR